MEMIIIMKSMVGNDYKIKCMAQTHQTSKMQGQKWFDIFVMTLLLCNVVLSWY